MVATSFSDLRVGDKVDCVVAVLRSEASPTKKGTKLLKICVSDRSSVSVLAKRWNATDTEIEDAKAISWARIVGEVGIYEGTLEIKLTHTLSNVPEPDDASSFVPASPLPLNELRARLNHYIESVQQPQLNALLRAVFIEDKTLSVAFETFPAAEIRHHAFRHGLIQHTLEVTDTVDAICTKHKAWGKQRGRLSRDLAVTGALLHDIGKLEEYEQDGHSVRFSAGGGLLGHITLGIIRLARKIAMVRKAIGFEEALEEVVLHMIVAHHGKTEYGTPIPPKTAEAALIHYADMVSTECFYFAEAQRNATEGDIAFKQWKMDGRCLYVAKLDCVWGEEPSVENVTLPTDLVWSAGEKQGTNSDAVLPASTGSRNRLTLPLLRLASNDSPNSFFTARLPLVGKVAAGQPILDSANIEDDICIEADGLFLDSGTYYVLRVQGDSMIGDDINDGDLIVVRHQEQAEWGDMVVAVVDEGATVKRLIKKDGQVQLQASNPAYTPILVPDTASLHIQGRVIAVAR